MSNCPYKSFTPCCVAEEAPKHCDLCDYFREERNTRVTCISDKESKRLALEAAVRELLSFDGAIFMPNMEDYRAKFCAAFHNLRKAYKELSE